MDVKWQIVPVRSALSTRRPLALQWRYVHEGYVIFTRFVPYVLRYGSCIDFVRISQGRVSSMPLV